MKRAARWLRWRIIRWSWFLPDRLSDKTLGRIPEWLYDLWGWAETNLARALCAVAGHELHSGCGCPEHAACIWCKR